MLKESLLKMFKERRKRQLEEQYIPAASLSLLTEKGKELIGHKLFSLLK